MYLFIIRHLSVPALSVAQPSGITVALIASVSPTSFALQLSCTELMKLISIVGKSRPVRICHPLLPNLTGPKSPIFRKSPPPPSDQSKGCQKEWLTDIEGAAGLWLAQPIGIAVGGGGDRRIEL